MIIKQLNDRVTGVPENVYIIDISYSNHISNKDELEIEEKGAENADPKNWSLCTIGTLKWRPMPAYAEKNIGKPIRDLLGDGIEELTIKDYIDDEKKGLVEFTSVFKKIRWEDPFFYDRYIEKNRDYKTIFRVLGGIDNDYFDKNK